MLQGRVGISNTSNKGNSKYILGQSCYINSHPFHIKLYLVTLISCYVFLIEECGNIDMTFFVSQNDTK